MTHPSARSAKQLQDSCASAACIRTLLAAAAKTQFAGQRFCKQACKGVRAAVPQVLLVLPFVGSAVPG